MILTPSTGEPAATPGSPHPRVSIWTAARARYHLHDHDHPLVLLTLGVLAGAVIELTAIFAAADVASPRLRLFLVLLSLGVMPATFGGLLVLSQFRHTSASPEMVAALRRLIPARYWPAIAVAAESHPLRPASPISVTRILIWRDAAIAAEPPAVAPSSEEAAALRAFRADDRQAVRNGHLDSASDEARHLGRSGGGQDAARCA